MSGVLKVVIATCAISLITAHLSPATAAPAAQVITCVDLASGKERISKSDTCRTTEATAKWHLAPTDSALASGGTTKSLTICSNKESSPVTYQRIRSSCYKHMQSNIYTRSAALPAKPVIVQVSSSSSESASLALSSDPTANLDAPIAYYTITSSKGDVKKVNSWRELTVTVSGLRSSTSYTFTITATSVDGTSPVSESSLPITTQVYAAPVTTSQLAVPAFTLSASAETKTAGNAITGYTVTSTGGTIATFAISPSAPAGLTFSTATGLLSGSPSSSQSATPYTITATNASGSATRTFTLTVTYVVYTLGQTGPGGGKVFYVSNTQFACGPTLNLTCNYLEAAPTSGTNAWTDAPYVWSGNTTVTIGTTGTAIGTGFNNTLAMIGQDNTAARAGTIAQAYRGPNNLTDWHLPSKSELNQMCKWANAAPWTSDATQCSGGTLNLGTGDGLGAAGFVGGYSSYWSSSEDTRFGFSMFAHPINFDDGGANGPSKTLPRYVRPIRAF
jgi:hypothetical protein